ncbi:MAG: glycosyltransferase family 4 protein [Mariprofundaceae bacterium]|nr:glycosyltransferase family 4 protein [Mariprofundaceae bacterium]
MRVMMLEPSGWGGIALYTHALCSALVEQGVEVRLLNNAHRDDLSHLSRNYEVVPVVRGDAWGSEWRRLRQQIDAWKPDIFHMQSVISSRRDMLAFLRHRLCTDSVQYILTVHNVLPHETAFLERSTFSWLYRLADGLVVHSEASLKGLYGLVPALKTPTAVIHHGHYGMLSDPDLLREDALKQLGLADFRYLACFGAIRPYKGVDWLLKAVAAVEVWPEDMRVLVAGILLTGVTREELEGLRSDLGIEDRVIFQFKYFTEAEIPAVFAVADAMLFSYKHIDQSGVMMASLAAGKPVICTPVGAFSEMIESSVGYISDAVSLDSFTASLAQALSHRDQWIEMGRNAAEKAEREYGWRSAAEKTVAFYRKVSRP